MLQFSKDLFMQLVLSRQVIYYKICVIEKETVVAFQIDISRLMEEKKILQQSKIVTQSSMSAGN